MKIDDSNTLKFKVLNISIVSAFFNNRGIKIIDEGAIVKVKDPIEYLKRLEFHKNSKNHEDYFF